MSAPMGESLSEKSTKIGAHVGRLVKIQDVDVAAGLDSDKPLEPEVATKLRYVIFHFIESGRLTSGVNTFTGEKSTFILCP